MQESEKAKKQKDKKGTNVMSYMHTCIYELGERRVFQKIEISQMLQNYIRLLLCDAYALIPSQRLWMTEIISFLAGISNDGCRGQETPRQHWLPSCRDVHHHQQEASYKSGKTKKRQKYLLLSFFGNNIEHTFSSFCMDSIIRNICFCEINFQNFQKVAFFQSAMFFELINHYTDLFIV